VPVGSGMGSAIFCNGAICSTTAHAVIVSVEDMIAGMSVCLDKKYGAYIEPGDARQLDRSFD
jgi:hypothetical protein